MGPTGGAGRGTTTRIAGPETAPGALRRRGLSRGSEIGTAEPPPPPSFLARLARHRTSHLYSPHALASMDGVRIRLPGRLDSLPPGQIADRYRLLALEQAARAHRARGPPFPPGMRCFGISTCSPKLPRSTQRWCACSLGLLRLSVRPGGKLRTPGRSFASPSHQDIAVEDPGAGTACRGSSTAAGAVRRRRNLGDLTPMGLRHTD
jgi:hypothetical protein